MSNRIYALLVGINDYAPEVGRLEGCLNDVDHFRDYLASTCDPGTLAIEVLKDADATRDNIISGFRTHLGRATDQDTAVFLYCGHGARWTAASEFKEFYPDGMDEGLVCYDSRRQNGTYPYDLADKELAVLLAEVARNNPHLAVILDCCHSGSGTRDVDAFRQLRARQTHEVLTERPLDSYIDGYYTARKRKDDAWFSIPASSHILLAACDRTQKAMESPDRSGVFSSTLLEVLAKSGGDISYADLFVRCRAAVRTRAEHQDPQFDAYGGFRAYSGFLGRGTSGTPPRYSVSYTDNVWTLDAGALHGFPTEPEKHVELVLYPDGVSSAAGRGSTAVVGAQQSEVQLDFDADTTVRYSAELTSLPVPPTPIYFAGDEPTRAAVAAALARNRTVTAAITDIAEGARYALTLERGALHFRQRETDTLIQSATLDQARLEESVAQLLPIIQHVVRWDRCWALQNQGTRMNASLVDFVFAEQLENGQEHEYPAGDIVLDFVKSGGEWQKIVGRFKVRNRTQQPLHVVFAHLSTAYGLRVFANEPVPPGGEWVTLPVDGDPKAAFWVDEPANHATERFKLFVSTEKVDDFLLEQDDLSMGATVSSTRGFGSAKSTKKYRNEWFTRNLVVTVVRQLNRVSVTNASLAQGKIVVKAHPSVKAALSLNAAKSGARSAGDGGDFYKAFEQAGLTLVNFAGTRGDNESVLELTDIQNASALKEAPLEIELDIPLRDDEAVLPVVFDGQHAVLGGDVWKDDNGRTQISIDHLPVAPDQRRSLTGSLKMYFFKTYLKQSVNQLRWVDYQADGSFTCHKSMVANKVAAAKNILLLVHGITGDTENMAKGVRAIGLDRRFDLVLTYDYENLATPIPQTAQALKVDLAAAGLQAGDDKSLTLLVHSMGGLVSRWFIEREGGNTVVDHLVMCGTPNNGSPLGRIEEARKILNVLASLAMTYLPALIPFQASALLLLNRSKKLTPTLEQMHPSSEFITTLNSSPDPGIRYTVLAGDVETYKEPTDAFFARMLEKAGQSVVFDALFAMKANDIAVGVDSILGLGTGRSIVPVLSNVACHHLNYFISDAGQRALEGVAWESAPNAPVVASAG